MHSGTTWPPVRSMAPSQTCAMLTCPSPNSQKQNQAAKPGLRLIASTKDENKEMPPLKTPSVLQHTNSISLTWRLLSLLPRAESSPHQALAL
jgi:hypothetical protein